MGGIKFGSREYSYSMFEAAKLICQYEEFVEEALVFNGSFKLWYDTLSPHDLALIYQDQSTRKIKQTAKNTGKVIGALVGMLFGVASFSKSPTKEIAEQAMFDTDVWDYLLVNGITYEGLRNII